MDTQTLERLLIDRALAALPPDCEALLDAYLAQHPTMVNDEREIGQTIALTRQALSSGEPISLPAFPEQRLIRGRHRAQIWRIARNVTGLAAAILIGFAARGFLLPVQPRSGAPIAQFVAAQDSALHQKALETNDGFWSVRRLYERASAAREQPAPRLIWRSPILLPQRGDAT